MSISPPSGWESSGTWDTHWTLESTGGNLSPRMLRLKSASAVTAWGPWIPVTPSGYHATYAQFQASANGGGDTFTIDFVQYQDDRTTITGTRNLFSGTATATGTWYTCGDNTATPANTAWGRYKIAKAASNFNLDIDQVYVSRTGPYAIGNCDGTVVGAAAWAQVTFTVGTNGLIDTSATANQFTARLPGMHVGRAALWCEIDDGDMVEAAWYVNAARWEYSRVRVYGSGAGQTWIIAPTIITSISPGDVLKVYVYATNGTTVTSDSYVEVNSPIVVS
jgi:hypothetical protein